MPAPSLALAAQPDEHLVAGKYALVEKLAVGGMGEVWAARNETTRAAVALKIVRGNAARFADAAERFRHEAVVSARVNHRNVIRVFDFLEEPDGTLVLVMELLDGETLSELLDNAGSLDVRVAVAIMVPVLSALDHAHELGVVHRDIKPLNLFLSVDPDGQVIPKLLDFGIAKLPDAGVATQDGQLLGTPRYMSPEQIRGDVVLDGRSDMFSAAVVLYEMLTGRCPFEAENSYASLASVLESEVPEHPSIPDAVWRELERALAKEPAQRHRTATEFAERLRMAVGLDSGQLSECIRRAKPALRRPIELRASTSVSGSLRRISKPAAPPVHSDVRPLHAGSGFRAKGRYRTLLACGLVLAGAAAASMGIVRARGADPSIIDAVAVQPVASYATSVHSFVAEPSAPATTPVPAPPPSLDGRAEAPPPPPASAEARLRLPSPAPAAPAPARTRAKPKRRVVVFTNPGF